MNSPALAREPDMPAARIGFIGLGWIGRKRLDAIAACDRLAVVAITDSDPANLDAAAQAHPNAAAVHSLADLLKCDLDGVVIATPNAEHAAHAIECLSRGVAVFCQKPLAIDAAQAEQVVDAARSAKRLLGIDYCYRHLQGMDELRRAIAGGELGQITAIDLTFHNAYAPNKQWCFDRRQSGGGCLLDLGVHLIDLALWLRDFQEMKLVNAQRYARGRPIRGPQAEIEDFALAEFRQADATVRIACSWNANIGCDALIGAQVHGARGGASWRNVNGSFFDFDIDLFHGTTRERIGSHPDEWGPRALHRWLEQLRHDRSFDPAAMHILTGARLIEEVYRQ